MINAKNLKFLCVIKATLMMNIMKSFYCLAEMTIMNENVVNLNEENIEVGS